MVQHDIFDGGQEILIARCPVDFIPNPLMKRTLLLSLIMSSAPEHKLLPKLARAWTKEFVGSVSKSSESSAGSSHGANDIRQALTRTLPLLQDGGTNPSAAVPFLCRYRTDVIHPLSVPQMHQLSQMIQTHTSLKSLRNRILDNLPAQVLQDDPHLLERIETSVSKPELEDLYAPYKPPPKGSLEVRLTAEHPELPAIVDALWQAGGPARSVSRNVPREAVVTLLANRISSHLPVVDACLAYTHRYGRIRVAQAATTKAKADTSKSSKAGKSINKQDDEKYQTYYDFDSSFSYVRDHQVLAVRRGVDQKALKLGFDLDADRAESIMRRALLESRILQNNAKHDALWGLAIHDAWSRLIRKRCTTRLWTQVSQEAQERAMQVFCDNLSKALLAPPMQPVKAVLALDPGFAAGIKCALLDEKGQVDDKNGLTTVRFANKQEDQGRKVLSELLQTVAKRHGEPVLVALGNGHGTQEARQLVSSAAKEAGITIEIHLVNEAGASVWSVTECASREFPDQPPAAVAAVSIGRRFQNPLPELVKIPPRSLGLGMYQHDMNEKELDDKLHTTSVDAVAEVGVDVNACSLEILEKVPGLTASLCSKIVKARPLKQRADLLSVSGLGPKTFENCAAFLRVNGGPEALDDSLVHPESYELARWLLQKNKWNLRFSTSKALAPTKPEVVSKAVERFKMDKKRVELVLDHLVTSITQPDPRLCDKATDDAANLTAGSTADCKVLDSRLAPIDKLREALPVRNIQATVRNVVDFGAFVDFGGERDGLLHRSRLGNRLGLASLLVGQSIGVDVLGASVHSNKVSVSLAGLGLPKEDLDASSKRGMRTLARSASSKSSAEAPKAKRRRTTKS